MIDFLAASAFTTTVRRAIYRDWCIRVGLKPRREELDDVAPPRRRLQRALPLW